MRRDYLNMLIDRLWGNAKSNQIKTHCAVAHLS